MGKEKPKIETRQSREEEDLEIKTPEKLKEVVRDEVFILRQPFVEGIAEISEKYFIKNAVPIAERGLYASETASLLLFVEPRQKGETKSEMSDEERKKD